MIPLCAKPESVARINNTRHNSADSVHTSNLVRIYEGFILNSQSNDLKHGGNLSDDINNHCELNHPVDEIRC